VNPSLIGSLHRWPACGTVKKKLYVY